MRLALTFLWLSCFSQKFNKSSTGQIKNRNITKKLNIIGHTADKVRTGFNIHSERMQEFILINMIVVAASKKTGILHESQSNPKKSLKNIRKLHKNRQRFESVPVQANESKQMSLYS